MNAETPAYSPIYIKAWAVLSMVLGFVLISMFLFGDTLLHIGSIIWSLLRWLASPII